MFNKVIFIRITEKEITAVLETRAVTDLHDRKLQKQVLELAVPCEDGMEEAYKRKQVR